MRTVKIKTKELLNVLLTNREKHIADYDEAMIGYREIATNELAVMLDQARAGEKIIRSVSAVEPRSHAESYDTAILMLEMSSDAIVELTMAEFSQYVEDKWTWKDAFNVTNSTYKK